ncbi:MAG TPA: hypothetical protein VJ732_10735, partial [Bryobacteraceae bacterium]|nr:hypothetical protein [Bryobacteraceae bacterium]
MIAHNLLAWSAQIAALVALAAGAAALLRLRLPGPRLFYWQMVLLACFLLPLVGPWKQEAATPEVSITMIAAPRPISQPAPRRFPPAEAGLWLLAAGALARAAWLAAGLWRLGRYRRRAHVYAVRERTPLLLSREVTGPVTFGALRPVVLLPE